MHIRIYVCIHLYMRICVIFGSNPNFEPYEPHLFGIHFRPGFRTGRPCARCAKNPHAEGLEFGLRRVKNSTCRGCGTRSAEGLEFCLQTVLKSALRKVLNSAICIDFHKFASGLQAVSKRCLQAVGEKCFGAVWDGGWKSRSL